MFSQGKRRASERQSDWIERLGEKRPLLDKQQLPSRVDRRRIRIEHAAGFLAIELTHIHTTGVWGSLHVVKKMTAVGQELRKAVTDVLRRLQLHHRRRITAGRGNS